MTLRIGVYPGSFDPIHNGHLDLIDRCRPLFDRLYVAILHNDDKSPLFSLRAAEETGRRAVELAADGGIPP